MNMMLRKILLLFLFFCIETTLLAVPAKPVKRVVTLKDGSRKEVVLRGDENVHFFASTTDDKFYVEAENDVFEEADFATLSARWSERLQARNQHRLARAEARSMTRSVAVASRAKKAGANQATMKGRKRGIVLLVEFSDKAMLSSHGRAFYEDFFNKEGFSESSMAGSVRDYFLQSSYGQFDLTFDVVGPFTMSRGMKYYGENGAAGDDKHPAEMVIEACRMAYESGVDFSPYDWDGDGFVDQVFVLYAGHGENQGASSYAIWPHEYALREAHKAGDGDGIQTFGSVMVDTYAVSCELAGSTGTRVDGVGTACHEFSHCLGLPDMYDIYYGGGAGMKGWDLLDSGSYMGKTNSGESPCTFTSYERMFCGWLQPEELKEGCMVSGMECLSTHPTAYIIYNDAHPDEFYLLENRQKIGFDRYLLGHGMLILHVDYDAEAWMYNEVNTSKSRQRMTLIPADGSLGDGNYGGDPWPGTTGNTSLTDTSKPAALLYNDNLDGRRRMGKPIEEISEAPDGTISFLFNGGVEIREPSGIEVLDCNESSFVLRWSPVEHASSYELELKEHENGKLSPSDAVLVSESFVNFNSQQLLNSNSPVDGILDQLMEVKGWEGENVYFSPDNQLRLGSNASAGALTTPVLHPSGRQVTILVRSLPYRSDTGKIVVMINDKVMGEVSPSLVGKNDIIVADVNADFRVTLKTNSKRAYLSLVQVFDGVYSEEEIKQFFNQDSRWNITSYETSGNNYLFSDLNSKSLYTFRLRAKAGVCKGPWSDWMLLDLSSNAQDPSSIAGLNVNKMVQCFDLTGRPVGTPSRKGVYIRDGRKVLLR